MDKAAIAPLGLPVPDFVCNEIHNVVGSIFEHGFGPEVVGPDWWERHLRESGLPQRVTTFAGPRGDRLTREDLFELGNAATGLEATPDDLLSLLWHVLAWGTGRSQRGNRRRVRAFAEAGDRAQNVELLRRAAASARDGDPALAYGTLVRRGGGKIPGLGPAFFTKFLYFACEGTSGLRSLILDARVAGSLARAGWTTLPYSSRRGYSYNWFTRTYTSYCELLDRWAIEESQRTGQAVRPDEIELILFRTGGK